MCVCVDIVFFIFLYQRWIYRVDPKRVNEFGTSGEDVDASEATQADSWDNGGHLDTKSDTSTIRTTHQDPPSDLGTQKSLEEKKNE